MHVPSVAWYNVTIPNVANAPSGFSMGELKTKRKVRENQVRAMGFIVSSNDALDEKTAREFLDRSINWFGARYGYENLLAAQIHLDEGTPHAHIWIAPVIHDAETGSRP